MTAPKREKGSAAFERFRKLTKRVVSVPKSEIDRRAKEHKGEREEAKSEAASE
jgi:hypothetical protein